MGGGGGGGTKNRIIGETLGNLYAIWVFCSLGKNLLLQLAISKDTIISIKHCDGVVKETLNKNWKSRGRDKQFYRVFVLEKPKSCEGGSDVLHRKTKTGYRSAISTATR